MVWSSALRKMAAMTPKKVIIRRSRPWCSSRASSAAWPVSSRSWCAASSRSRARPSSVRVSANALSPMGGGSLFSGAQQLRAQVSQLQLLLLGEDSHHLAHHHLVDPPCPLGHAVAVLGHAHYGRSPVSRVVHSLDEARRLEPVHQPRDIARCDPEVTRDGVHVRSGHAVFLDAFQGTELAVGYSQ